MISVTYSYGDVTPTIEREMILAVCIMIAGVLFFGYIIASFAANLANADTARASFQQKINAIKNFMNVRGVFD